MSGRYSKNKGRRNEYLLRDSLRLEGFTAERVPLSGASAGEKGDVKFSKDGREWRAEAKLRGDGTFKRIYDLFGKYAKDGSFSVAISEDDGPLVLVSVHDTMAKAITGPDVYPAELQLAADPNAMKATKKLAQIRAFMQTCDFLVIRGDRLPFLYIRYR